MTQKDDHMTDGFYIEKATVADAAAIADIERECFSEPWSEKAVADEITANNVSFVVCKNACGCVAGYVSGRNNCGEFYVSNIAVTARARRCGVGESLIKQMTGEAEKLGCEFITLEVREHNTAARRLYEKCGFAVVGQRKEFYRAPTENAVLYTKLFNKSENLQ